MSGVVIYIIYRTKYDSCVPVEFETFDSYGSISPSKRHAKCSDSDVDNAALAEFYNMYVMILILWKSCFVKPSYHACNFNRAHTLQKILEFTMYST